MSATSGTLRIPRGRELRASSGRAAQIVKFASFLALLVALALGVYSLLIRPWHLRWGASDAEASMALPGDALVPDAQEQRTRAVSINAPAGAVFPWLRQLGWERGGLYSYDWLENFAGLGFTNADHIHPEWQHTVPGDLVSMGPPGKSPAPFVVAQVEPDRAFVLGHRTDDGRGWVDSWQFVLDPVDAHTTRLLLRARSRYGDEAMRALMFAIEPMVFVMERGMLLGIQERAERQP